MNWTRPQILAEKAQELIFLTGGLSKYVLKYNKKHPIRLEPEILQILDEFIIYYYRKYLKHDNLEYQFVLGEESCLKEYDIFTDELKNHVVMSKLEDIQNEIDDDNALAIIKYRENPNDEWKILGKYERVIKDGMIVRLLKLKLNIDYIVDLNIDDLNDANIESNEQ